MCCGSYPVQFGPLSATGEVHTLDLNNFVLWDTEDAESTKASVFSIASTSNQPFGTGYIIGDIQRKYLFILPGLPRQSN